MNFLKKIFQNKNKAGSTEELAKKYGIALGVDKSSKERKEEENVFLSNVAKQIKPCERSFEELEKYLVKKYQAVPHNILPHEISALKANVILNHFSNIINKPMVLKEDFTEDEIKQYLLYQDAIFLQAREYPAEKLGLEFKAYKIQTGLSENEITKKISPKKRSAVIKNCYFDENVIIQIEKKTKCFSMNNGNIEIMFDLQIYSGVSEKDIIEKSPRFIGYAYALRHFGKL